MNFEKFVKTPFLQNTTTQLLLIIAVSTVNYFRQKTTSQMFDRVENRLQTKGIKILSSLLFPVFKLSRENNQLENMFDIIFEKTMKGAYAEATVQRVL